MQRTHGQTTVNGKFSPTKVYRCWANMIQRCTNPHNSNYKNYGKRGIVVCERWKKFENFYADMGDPLDKTTLDRINNDGNYEPSNCRWATATEQAQNTRRATAVTVNGETNVIAEWLRKNNIPYPTYKQRRRNGWSIEDAVSVPSRQRKREQGGEANSKSKLTAEQVYEIRRRRDAKESLKSIAKDFPFVSWKTLSPIGKRESWKHLPEK